jgi:hypothetical protein
MTIRSKNGEPGGSDGTTASACERYRHQDRRRGRFGTYENYERHGQYERFDRQIRAFGAEAQTRLGRLTVGVVGAGGAGSLLVQGLAHMGVGHLVIVDPDVLDTTNLNRVVGSTPMDAEARTPKVDVAARLVRAVDPFLQVAPIRGSVLDSAVWRLLRCADILVGAVDGHAPRWALNMLAVQYSRFYIDVGVEIGTVDITGAGGVERVGDGFACGGGVGNVDGGVGGNGTKKLEVGGRVAVVRPGGPCLLCQPGWLRPETGRRRTRPGGTAGQKVRRLPAR